MGPDLIARLGLNKDRYSAGLRDAEKDFQHFSRRTSESGKGAAEQLTHSFRGVHEVLKAFGAVAVFREFIGWFQDISEYAKKFGDQTDENTKAAVRWGAAYKGSIDAVKTAGVQVLGFFTKAGEGLGAAARFLMGDKVKDIRQAHQGDNDAAQAEAARDAYLKANDPEKVKSLRKEIATIDKEIAFARMTDGQKVEELEKNQARIEVEKGRLGIRDVKARLELELELAENARKAGEVMKHAADEVAAKQKQAADKEKELHKERADRIKELGQEEMNAAQHVQDLKDRLARGNADRSKMTVRELANLDRFTPGASVGMGEQGEAARKALGLQSEADRLRKAGDAAGAAGLYSQADSIMHGLAGAGGPLKSTEDPAQSALAEEIKISNRHLQDIDDKISALTTSN